MATAPNMRVLLEVVFYEDGEEPTVNIHEKPHADRSDGGPPELCQRAGVEQVIAKWPDRLVVYRWVELGLIPDPLWDQ